MEKNTDKQRTLKVAKGSGYDWDKEYDELLALEKKDPDYQIKVFCEDKPYNYSVATKKLKEIRMKRAQETYDRFVPRAVATVGELMERSGSEDIQLKAANSILDRSSKFSREATKSQINLQNNIQINIPPLFGGSNGKELEQMGEIVDVKVEEREGEE